MLTNNITLTDSQFESLKKDLILLSMPFVSVADYSRIKGETEVSVRQQIHKGLLPIKSKLKAREKTFINLEAIRQEAQAAA
ncbi:hypothetical protein [Colwellia psychrerythraea]|uniref:Putative transcriptional regulator n=1 Tax=Colwellia psychrerythraea (strain 34H / ATCC BAA-681) TaxID=167879 RepID=Q487X7_COLP3|nr:hypothetical protein [Colwellia psychrerythraea]AAZ27396.1 putative transcriptional regulator [Colwellia psychrerythraea 34H]